MELQSAARRVFRSWLIHWLTSVALTLLVVALLSPFSNSALFRFLDHVGGDAVMRVYGGGPQPVSPVVLVDLGPDPKIDFLTGVLNQIAGTRAQSVGLDFVVSKLPPGPDGKADERITKLRDALKALVALGISVAMPITDAIADLPEIHKSAPNWCATTTVWCARRASAPMAVTAMSRCQLWLRRCLERVFLPRRARAAKKARKKRRRSPDPVRPGSDARCPDPQGRRPDPQRRVRHLYSVQGNARRACTATEVRLRDRRRYRVPFGTRLFPDSSW